MYITNWWKKEPKGGTSRFSQWPIPSSTRRKRQVRRSSVEILFNNLVSSIKYFLQASFFSFN